MLRLLLTLFLDESVCASLLRLARRSNGIYCPSCCSSKVKRHGKYKKIFQRYQCKECSKTFNDKTGTVFHYSHLSLSECFLAIYLFCVISWLGCSISSISSQLGIPYRQCYHMIRAIMDEKCIFPCWKKCDELMVIMKSLLGQRIMIEFWNTFVIITLLWLC
jgi:transposase-like protein